jgi:hypothetical protein
LAQEAVSVGASVSVADLEAFAKTFADLANDTVMIQAWH